MMPKLRFKNYKKIEEKKLIDFAPLQRGYDLPVSQIESGDYPVVFSNGILKKHSQYKVKGPGVVTGRSGTIGKVTYVHKDFWPHNTSLFVTNFFNNVPKYVYYYYQHIDFSKFATGSGVPTLNRNDLHSLDILVPEIDEQAKIADFLSSVDERITLLNKQYNLICQYKKGMMQKIFSQEVRFKDDNGTTFPDWENQKLGDVAVFLKGKGVAKTDVVEYGERECIRYGELYTDYGEVISKIKSRTNQSLTDSILSMSRDVLVPSSGETAIDISKASCVLSDGVILGGDLNIIRSKSIDGMFLSYYINSQKKYEIAQMAQGNSVVHLYAKQLAKTEIFYPCKKEQTKIANFLSYLDDKIAVKKAELDTLKTWKQGLLQQMFV